MAEQLLILGVGVTVLYFGAEWLVQGAARLARRFQVSSIVVGLTVVSLGTSAPELVVALVATVQGQGDLAIGNVLGSNLANIGLILGLTACVQPLRVAARVVSREGPIMLAMTLLLFPLLFDREISRAEGGLLLILLFGYLSFVMRSAREEPEEVLGEYEQYAKDRFRLGVPKRVVAKDIGLVLLGCLGLVLGGRLIVSSASWLAASFGVSEFVIGISIVAIGTSLPELATSLVAALRKEADIAVGNIVGSNIFNMTAILGTASVVAPMRVSSGVLRLELPAVFLISAILLPVLRTQYTIRRFEGALLLGAYIILGTILLGPR